MSTFEDVLNTPMNAVEKPKPRPVGTYLGVVQGQPKIEKIGQKETLAAIFEVKLLSPGPDVDTESLAEAGGIGERNLRVTQFLTKDALWRTKEFLTALGIDVDTPAPVGQLIAQATNCRAYFKIRHRPSQDGKELYEEFVSAAAL